MPRPWGRSVFGVVGGTEGGRVFGAERVRERDNGRRWRGNGDQVLLGHLRASTFTPGKTGSAWKVPS